MFCSLLPSNKKVVKLTEQIKTGPDDDSLDNKTCYSKLFYKLFKQNESMTSILFLLPSKV